MTSRVSMSVVSYFLAVFLSLQYLSWTPLPVFGRCFRNLADCPTELLLVVPTLAYLSGFFLVGYLLAIKAQLRVTVPVALLSLSTLFFYLYYCQHSKEWGEMLRQCFRS